MSDLEEYDELHDELSDFEDLLEDKKHLIKTPEMKKFYNRIIHDLRWLMMEVEEELTDD